jgi:hypothetical protein
LKYRLPVFLCAVVCAALTASPSIHAQGSKAAASAYAVQLPMKDITVGGLHRIALPAQVMVALQTPGNSDLRIFDANGQAMPMALTNLPSAQTQQQRLSLPAFPILGSTTAGAAQGFSLRVEEAGSKRVLQIDGNGQPVAGANKVVGALLDARAITDAAVALELQVEIPNAQPIAFELQASKNLQNWQTLGDAVLYRVEGAQIATSNRLNFASFAVKDHYLRITWRDTQGSDIPVTVQGATLITAASQVRAPQVSAKIAATHASAHEMSFALPFATPLAALEILPVGSNVLAPVRVLGRNDRSQGWRLLTSGVVYQLERAGQVQRNGRLELGSASVREIKIEADAKTPGFVSPPAISVWFEPAQIVFLASGNAPYTLAAGLAAGVNAYLPLQSLIPGYESGAENKLPLATAVISVDASGNAAPVITAPPSSPFPPMRTMVLWGVLVAGALALALMAWVLMKQMKKPSG